VLKTGKNTSIIDNNIIIIIIGVDFMSVEEAKKVSKYLRFFKPLSFFVHTFVLTAVIITVLLGLVAFPLYTLSLFLGEVFAALSTLIILLVAGILMVFFGAIFYFEALPKIGDLYKFYDYDHQVKQVLDRRVCLNKIPEFMLTSELILESIQSGTHYTFKSLPEELLTYDICFEAVKSDGRSLKHVPERFRDKELCKQAVKDCGEALQFVPKDLRDKDICVRALDSSFNSFAYVPKALLDEDFCLRFIKDKASLIKRVPPPLRTEDFYNKAFNVNPDTIEYIPEHLVTFDMIYKSLETDHANIRLLEDEFEQDYFIYLMSTNHTPNEDSWIHYKLKENHVNPEIYKDAFFEIHFFRVKDSSNKIVFTCSKCSDNVLGNYLQQGYKIYDYQDQCTLKHCFECGAKERDSFSK